MDIAEKVYNFMKSSKDKDGFMPTVQQIVDEINVPEHEVKATLEELEKSGRIKITDTAIEFVE